MIDVKIIKKAKQGHVSVGGGIATAGNNYTTGIQQTLADVLNFNAGLTRLLKPYDANNQPLTWAQATDPDGDGGIKAKTLRAAVTFASVGDVVAYQNGNLSGGTGGGGLDITALESYLTTNGYATQDWVSAHFNDYVLTKAAVEAVLTGNITTHTHNQYLTAHQSLANYYTKAESDGKYLLSSAYTAADILTKLKTVDGAGSGLDADTVDGYHENQLLHYRGYLSTEAQRGNSWTRMGTSVPAGVLPDGLMNKYPYGVLVSFATYEGRLELYASERASRAPYYDGLYYRTGWQDTKGEWLTLLDTANYAATLDGRYYTESEINAMLTNGSVTKVGTATIGSAAHPIYLNAGTPTACGYSFGNATGNAALNNGTLNVSLNADMLDGVHGKDYVYYPAYNCENGCLVRLKLEHNHDYMLTVHIRGNSYYGLRPIDTWVQFYYYKTTGTLIGTAALHIGYDFGNINVFCYDGHIYLWLKQKDNYQSFSVYAECTNEYYVGNLVENITNAAMPTEGVTRLVTITPQQSALTTDNVASATKLQTARTINGTAFDGTAAITTAKWGTARNLTIGNTAKSVDGSSAMAWSLAEIGALGVNANAVSATKLQTARSIWGQSFDGTDNVAGTLSGVEDITFNANAKIAATDNHLRLLTKSGGAQGLAAVQLLASDLYADWAKVPANGIYSKGDIVTDGTIKIGGGTITWDAGNNAFMFSHTVASQGDMVAFQNGNLSGGSGGGGLDITALESYLTTNGYATQDWVAAHFNDYVLTKAAVEAVLTGNITTHTHNQYLTEHQSLANYYTKTEADGKYLTAINKSMVEAVLTGNITTHTHNQYLTEHQSLANYMTRGEIGDTYQAKSTALSFTAATGYVAARFTDAALATAAAQNYIELWDKDGWFNLQAGYLLAHGAVTATQFIRTGGTATQFLKADGSVDANTYLTTGAASDTYLPKATYTASDILTKIKTVDGSGSGLDADLLDGKHLTEILRYEYNPTSKTSLDDRSMISGIDMFDWGYAYAPNVAGQPSGDGAASAASVVTFGTRYPIQIYSDFNNTDLLYYRSFYFNTGWKAWRQFAFIDSNVASATKLKTARTINGTAFDGTAAITTAKWGTARNLTIGNTAKSVDGSTPVAWSLAEIGALGVNANAVSASKLATPHTLWGQSFDGTDNVAGSLSGVEEIIFNANARLNATDNAFRFLTKGGGAQGIQAGNLLISNLFSDANKVPENGIYSKDGLVTDGSIKIGGGTITWDEATNSFIFSHTVASQGDVVAFKQ